MYKNHNSCLYIFQIVPFGVLINAILCPFSKLKTVQAIWLKLHTVVEHNETMCHVQEPQLCFAYFWIYLPLIICNAILCLLCKLKTVTAI